MCVVLVLCRFELVKFVFDVCDVCFELADIVFNVG